MTSSHERQLDELTVLEAMSGALSKARRRSLWPADAPEAFSPRQIVPQAVRSFGQPRPTSCLGRAGRAYRPCLRHERACFPHRFGEHLTEAETTEGNVSFALRAPEIEAVLRVRLPPTYPAEAPHLELSCPGAAAAALESACTELCGLAAAAACGDGEECGAALAQRFTWLGLGLGLGRTQP